MTATLQRRRRLTRAEVDNLVDLYATGINVRRLAAAFGINRAIEAVHAPILGGDARAVEMVG